MIIEWQSGQFYQQSTYQEDTIINRSTAAFALDIVTAVSNELYQKIYQPLYQKVYTTPTR